MIFGIASSVLCVAIGCSHSLMRYRQTLSAKDQPTPCQPDSGIEPQMSVTDLRSCKSGNSNAIWSFLYTLKVLTAFIGNQDSDTLGAPSRKWVWMVRERFLAFHDAKTLRDALVIVYIQCYDHCSWLKWWWTLSCMIQNDISCYDPGGCRRNIACLSA